MCQVCIARESKDSSAIRAYLRDLYRGLSATLSAKNCSQSFRDFYIKMLRETADEIESNTRAEGAMNEALKGVEEGLKEKARKVEAYLLGEESKFYTEYGTVMPTSVRMTLRARFWDSLEQESSNDRDEREPSSLHEGTSRGQSVSGGGQAFGNGPTSEDHVIRRAE